MENEKKIITVIVFEKIDYKKPIPLKDITVELQPDDIITQQYVEADSMGDESWDGHWMLEVERDREETDEEYQKRIKEDEFFQEEMRKRRYKNYLKLKKEFEENSTSFNFGLIETNIKETDGDKSIDKCISYDFCQGRHKCYSHNVIGGRCIGICPFYQEKIK
jgi:hypothetical protein